MSAIDPALSQSLHCSFIGSPELQSLIETLKLQPHPEGGYFLETDRDPRRVSVPSADFSSSPAAGGNTTRNASTTIYYLLTPKHPVGVFHRNKGRTVHTLHRGRGRYVIIHANEKSSGGKKRVETFVVGPDVLNGEKVQWIVEGGKYKASFLLPDNEDEEGGMSGGLLISEMSFSAPSHLLFIGMDRMKEVANDESNYRQ